MNISDCIVKEENRNERRRIEVYFPGCVTISSDKWDCEGPEINEAPTFGEIYDEISSDKFCLEDLKRPWGENYEEAFANVEITVQTETAGYKYLCNFRDKVFEEIEDEDVLSLAEEEKKREKFREKEAAARKIFNKKQIVRLVVMLVMCIAGIGVSLVDNELGKPAGLLCYFSAMINGLCMISAKIRFEDGLW